LQIEQPKNDHFVLNLKNYDINLPEENNIQEAAKNATKTATKKILQKAKSIPSKVSAPDFSKLNSLSLSKSKQKRKTSKTFQNLKFVFNTIMIFLVTFVALNWGSYRQVFITYYNQVTGQTSETLTVFSDETKNPETAYASSSIISDNFSIPKLTKEITPPGTRIIIPSINTNVPVVDVPEDKLIDRNWTALENDIQNALRSGVVHYPGTPSPGQSGNVVITGHSSYYPWDPGRFKDVFAVLHNLKNGDEIIIFHKQQKYTYKISEVKKVFPYEVDVLNDFNDDRLTLITCTPIGTNLKRLIITAKPV
jgi:LPXTG-site transpeptidase (sortase) family protein